MFDFVTKYQNHKLIWKKKIGTEASTFLLARALTRHFRPKCLLRQSLCVFKGQAVKSYYA